MFIHDALLEAIACGVTEVEAKDLSTRLRELRQVDAENGYTNLENEFCRLAKEENHPIAFKSASLNCNTGKNRYANILPCKYYRKTNPHLLRFELQCLFKNSCVMFYVDCHHHHHSAAEQVTTSFLQLQWSWAILVNCR